METQRGVALLTALLIMALVTVVAVAMTSRQQLDIRRTGNVLTQDQAYLFALGVESWGIEVLTRDRADNQTDHLKEDWATVLPPLDVEGAKVAGRIEDMQGRFNLNNLVVNGKPSAPDVARFKRLLQALELPPQLADAVIDWMDPDTQTISVDGAEDGEYLTLQPPYRAANRPFTSPTELRLVKGFKPKVMEKLLPLVTALPTHTAINVNTARTEVLMALADNITKTDATALADDRGAKGYAGVDKFLANPVIKGRTIVADGLSVASDYFLIQSEAKLDRQQIQLYTLVTRVPDKATPILRAQGVY